MPRLWPFLKHTIRSVRQAALETLDTLLMATATTTWLPGVLTDAMRLIYQRTLIEPVPEILETVHQVSSEKGDIGNYLNVL